MTDVQLVSRARLGDTTAFGELVERHRTAVFRAALAALGSPDEADDVAQEACVLAFRKLASFRGDASFKTWLLAIAWRQALTRRRALSGWLQSLRGLPGWGESNQSGARDPAWDVPADAVSGAASESPEQAVLQDERMRAVASVIRALPTKLRDCLLLAGSGEYSYDEIARMVDAPVGTVKWRVSEARRQVKARLARRGFGS